MWSKNARNKDWEMRFDRMAMSKTKTRKFGQENQGIKEQDFITLVLMCCLLGVHSSEIKTYVDEFMWRQKQGRLLTIYRTVIRK